MGGCCSGAGVATDAGRGSGRERDIRGHDPAPPGQHRLTVWVQGKGRVTSSPAGIDCETASCSADFPSGTTVTLTPAPASGYGFAGWGTDCSGAGGCTLPLSKDATVYANFVAQPPRLLPHRGDGASHCAVTGPGTVTAPAWIAANRPRSAT